MDMHISQQPSCAHLAHILLVQSTKLYKSPQYLRLYYV